MIPLVFNEDLSRLVQLSMEGSVGHLGRNLPPDVRLIQSLLNATPESLGGPSQKLAVDGLVGPKSIAAISRFQVASRLRFADGRIDPRGPTIIALGRLLNSRGLIPSGVQGIGSPDPRVRAGLVGGGAPLSSRSALLGSTGVPGITPLDWKFNSSAGVSIGALIFGVAAMTFHLEKDSRPGFVRQFPWSGFGVGLSTTPVGLDISFADMPSFGLRLRQGHPFANNPMPEDDFAAPCTVYSMGASLGPGIALTICMFGAVGPLIMTSRAIGVIAGMEVGIPGAGVMGFFGVTGRASN